MKNFLNILLISSLVLFLNAPNALSNEVKKESVSVVIPSNSHVRLQYGAKKLAEALFKAGYKANVLQQNKLPNSKRVITVGLSGSDLIKNAVASFHSKFSSPLVKEGFTIASSSSNIIVAGTDNSGALYGCLELVDRINSGKTLPENLNISDQPEMVLRGTSIGMQKPYYLPGRTVYEYPYTPELFSWFYDKDHWVKYLDMMVENRYNSLYLWNGHPFASLVKLKDYPYAVEVDDATLKKNEEMFLFLTQEADKRGIWVIQMFYNIIVSKPFAEKHNIKTQDRNRPITPLLSDYTRKSITAFVEKYPNVGLLVTLGEAMEGVGQDDVDWFTKTIIPGVKDGLKALGQTTEPPIVLRAHDSDAPRVMKAALPIYKNLYTMAKYNGEALTTYTPRGKWAELHRSLSRIGTVHIQNVHILANLEPFRYSSPDFIQKSVQAMHNIYEANGLHLYPQASYWDWPYTADKTKERLLQIDRDWMWYKTWARYAWKADRDKKEEENYWGKLLGETFGLKTEQGKQVLEAHEEAGEISPKLLRRYGITDGNRQTLTLGMLMTQLINPFRYGLFTLLYESEAPEGEMIIEYAEKEAKGEKHIGETPIQVAEEVVVHGRKAVEAIEKAAPYVTKNKEEFERLKNDMYCYNAMANFYSEKAKAAIAALRFKYSDDVKDLETALPYLERSVKHFADLVNLTKDTYLYANSMQTAQRKIPMRGVDATYIHWVEMLPVFQKEVDNLKRSIDSLKTNKSAGVNKKEPFKNADVKLLTKSASYYTLTPNQSVFADTVVNITDLAVELQGLKGIRLPKTQQLSAGTSLKFSASKPVKLLVGYFNSKEPGFARAPELETDASANDYGQGEIKISNAIIAGKLPTVNVHTYSISKGTHTLNLPKGALLLLGFIDGSQEVKIYNAGMGAHGKEIDWVFE
ncbi:MAG: alpha-d-galacturonidase [Sphingobacteriaceae bacterium]